MAGSDCIESHCFCKNGHCCGCGIKEDVVKPSQCIIQMACNETNIKYGQPTEMDYIRAIMNYLDEQAEKKEWA